MTLAAGTRLGPYEIVSMVGSGGMGEVYRARDPRLGRDVAVKVLRSEVADSNRMRRFEQEARALGALNHSNILAIHDFGTHKGSPYVVSELLEGDPLRARLEAGPLPATKSVDYGLQIVSGLAAAHDKGIIHRDLKPENLFATRDGRLKILDFGLAKLTNEGTGAHDDQGTTATEVGVVVGTAGYMSPEQVRGEAVDHRSDIFSFGVVLYEMLSGERAFRRDSRAETHAAILTEDPPELSGTGRRIPPGLARIVRRCLEKRAGDRFQSTHDLALALEAVSAGGFGGEVTPPTGSRPVARGRWWLAALALLLLGLGAIVGRGVDDPPKPRPVHLDLVLPPEHQLANRLRVIALSQDGSQIAFVAGPDQRIWVRPLGTPEATPVPGTDGGLSPFFSPDGAWLGFWKDGKLQKVALGGGSPIALCPARTTYGAIWRDEDRILFSQPYSGLYEVSADGGEPKLLIPRDRSRDEIAIDGPRLLPDGRSLLFSILVAGQHWNSARIYVERLDTGERRLLVDGGTDPRYLPSGHLLFVRDSSLFAMPFDIETLEVSGSPIPVLDDLRRAHLFETGAGQYDVAPNGTLAYASGPLVYSSTLVTVDRAGAEQELPIPPRDYIHARISPDGRRIALDTVLGQDIWTYEVDRGAMTRLTSAHTSLHPVWTADGKALVFDAQLGTGLERKAVDGAQPAELIASEAALYLTAVSASPDGRVVAVERSDDLEAFDIGILPLDGGDVEPLLADPRFRELSPVFSPDGRWLAYVSDESGKNEVYVQPYPQLDQRWPVSTGGGVEPAWSPKGNEIFYRTGPRASILMAVPVRTEPRFEVGQPKKLFEKPPGLYQAEAMGAHQNYDVWPDGERFLFNKMERGPPLTSIRVVLNWQLELADRVPVP